MLHDNVFWSAFSRIRTEYSVSLRIQSKCGKIWTRKSSVFGRISCSAKNLLNRMLEIKLMDLYFVKTFFGAEEDMGKVYFRGAFTLGKN